MPTSALSELLHLSYQAQQELLIGRWGYQPSRAELAPAYERLQAMALNCRARFWLQDIRLRTLHDPYTTQWLFSEFFPDISQQLCGQLRVAYLVGPSYAASSRQDPIFSRYRPTQASRLSSIFLGKSWPPSTGCTRSRPPRTRRLPGGVGRVGVTCCGAGPDNGRPSFSL